MQQIRKIGIIGAGNMGGAIARGLVRSGHLLPAQITLTNPHAEKLHPWQAEGYQVSTNNADALSETDAILLAVKPYLVASVAQEIAPLLQPEQLILSVAAQVSIADLEQCFGTDKSLYRVVPNTAIAQRESMTAICPNPAGEQQQALVLQLFEQLGEASLVSEALIPAVTALASCGIAFAMRYLRAAMLGGIEMGLTARQAQFMAAQTMKGAAQLLLSDDSHPEVEIDKVCTPAGITIKGLNELEHAGFSSAVIQSLLASHREMKH